MNVVKSADLISFNKTHGKYKEGTKVSKIIGAFESNYSCNTEPNKSDYKSTVDIKAAIENNVGSKRDAFRVLISGGGGKTPR